MTSFLYSRGIRIFDCARFAEPLRERIRQRAKEVCAAAGVKIESVNKCHIRKEDLVARALAARGDALGLVHVISAMESCPRRAATASRSQFLERANLGSSRAHSKRERRTRCAADLLSPCPC